MGILASKNIIVTGASRGLGESMAVGFAGEGARVVLAARSKDDLDRVAGRCREAGASDVAQVATDITDEEQVAELLRVAATHSPVDVVVANAATSNANVRPGARYRELSSFDLDVVEELFRVNAVGHWLTTKHALLNLGEGGALINIGSSTGRLAFAGAGIYGVSKATVDVMTRIAAKEVADQGIRVNCLNPGGMVDTHLFGPDKMPEALKQRFTPLDPDVMVPAAVWLASDDARDVTGAFVTATEFNDDPDAAKAAARAASA